MFLTCGLRVAQGTSYCGHCDMQICHSDVDTFRKSVGSTRKRRYQNDNCRRSFPFRGVLILYISQESRDDCLHMDFKCFKLELWPTLRQKFMSFRSFLTRPGDKHDAESKRSAIAFRLPSEAGPSSRFCRESQDVLTFHTTRLPVSWFFSEISF